MDFERRRMVLGRISVIVLILTLFNVVCSGLNCFDTNVLTGKVSQVSEYDEQDCTKCLAVKSTTPNDRVSHYCLTVARMGAIQSQMSWPSLNDIDNTCQEVPSQDLTLCVCDDNESKGCDEKKNLICYHDDFGSYVSEESKFKSGCMACGGGKHEDTFRRQCIKDDDHKGFEGVLGKTEDACFDKGSDGHVCVCYSDWCNLEVPNVGSTLSKMTAAILAISAATFVF